MAYFKYFLVIIQPLFLGKNFRERERIKRKQQRWTDRLRIMPILERRALLAAMREAWPELAPSKTAIPADTARAGDACRILSPETTMRDQHTPRGDRSEKRDVTGART